MLLWMYFHFASQQRDLSNASHTPCISHWSNLKYLFLWTGRSRSDKMKITHWWAPFTNVINNNVAPYIGVRLCGYQMSISSELNAVLLTLFHINLNLLNRLHIQCLNIHHTQTYPWPSNTIKCWMRYRNMCVYGLHERVTCTSLFQIV